MIALSLAAVGVLLPSGPLTVEGFGAATTGGAGGRVLVVTRRDDAVETPLPGMLRWALMQKGARVVTFGVEGNIDLQDRIVVRENGRLTVDGGSAPGMGICIRGGSLEFLRCEEVVLSHLRVRLGTETPMRKLKESGRGRPEGSEGLDCLEVKECRRVVLDHLSVSWSCDELLAVVRSREVTVQHCLLYEPLAVPKLHPYGNRHAFGLLASASTLTVHHCVIAHYWMRGPQFEANDMRRGDDWQVKMEAVGNVLFDYGRSGSRYTTGVEDHREEAAGRTFAFHFDGNVYLDAAGAGREVEAVTKHGIWPGVKVWEGTNWVLDAETWTLNRVADGVGEGGAPLTDEAPTVRRQRVPGPLFRSPAAPRADLGGEGLVRLLGSVGCSRVRDRADERVLADLRRMKSRPVVKSVRQAGGWPRLEPVRGGFW